MKIDGADAGRASGQGAPARPPSAPLTPVPPLPLPRIFGRYLLVERVGRGGMGEVFLARHGMSGFEKVVVIKKVLPHLAADREFISRFVDEAQVAVQLQHANIVQVHEVGRVDDEYFLALEFVTGCDLRATLVALDGHGRRMPPALALHVAREVAAGLAYAHRRTDAAGKPLALVHCDISPPNILLSFDGEVKIIDFGVARSARRVTETNPDRAFGKLGYLAPEQMLRGHAVDQRTDVYALGVVLYEMLVGRRMFEVGESPDYRAVARLAVKGLHPLPSHTDPALAPFDHLVARALRPDPAERYQSAAELRDAIQLALIATDPTINGDHLTGLLEQLMPRDPAVVPGLADIDRTDLEHWRRELDNQASSTVSFALAEAHRTSPVAPHDLFDLGPTPAVAGTRPVDTIDLPPDAIISSEPEPEPDIDIDIEPTLDRLRPAPPGVRSRLFAGAALLAIGAVGALLGGIVLRALRPSPAAGVAVTTAAATAADRPAPPAPVAVPLVSTDPPGPASAASVRAVEARLAAAAREHQRYAARRGAGLAVEWSALRASADATFAHPDRAALRELDREIAAFRALIRADR